MIFPPHAQTSHSSLLSLSLDSLLLTFTCIVALGTLELRMGFHSICGLGLWPLWVCFGHGSVTELCHRDSAEKSSLTGCEAEKATEMLNLIFSICEKLEKAGGKMYSLFCFTGIANCPRKGWSLAEHLNSTQHRRLWLQLNFLNHCTTDNIVCIS